MWIFTNTGFISVVEPSLQDYRGKADMLLVRARGPGEIESIFGKRFKVTKTPDRDYLFRALIPRETVAEAVAKQVFRLDYGNFKNSIRKDRYHNACGRVWGAMFSYQEELSRPRNQKAWDF
jgi:hypothetical protein